MTTQAGTLRIAEREPTPRVTLAYVSCSVMLLFTFLAGCKEAPQPEPVRQSEPVVVSPEKQAYLAALQKYNDFVEHPKGHVYNVYPKERGLELCYLSGNVLAASYKVPEFASDRNDDNEIKEWRRWVDIRQYELHCEEVGNGAKY